jgi:hypothetical protein
MANYDSGFGSGNLVKVSDGASWENIISNYDHVYIVIRSGRAKGTNSKPGTDDTKYKLYLSQGPWPLVEGDV